MMINVQKVVESFFRLSDLGSDFKGKDVIKKIKKITQKCLEDIWRSLLILMNISYNSFVLLYFIFFHIYDIINSNW